MLARLNGQPVLGLNVIRQANSNTIEISDGIMLAVERINERFTDLEVVVTDDQALFIRDSVAQVLLTLALSMAVVVSTIWIFMGSLRATLVPGIAIPVSLIGTLAAIRVESASPLTLFGQVEAVQSPQRASTRAGRGLPIPAQPG